MKRLILMTVLALLVSPVMAGPTVATVNGYGIWQSGTGGEFSLKPGTGAGSWGWDPLPYYVGSTKNQGTTGSFQTFCIEEHEFIYANTTFDVVFNDRAIMGGNPPTGDPLSVGAAWLYHDFQKEALTGYDYTTVVGRHASAIALQNTLWWLEGEAGDPGLGNIFRNAVIAQFANPMADNNGQYGVKILNLYALGHAGDLTQDAFGDYIYLRQDVLVCVPAPGAILLGSVGVGLVGWMRRRRTL